MSSPALPAFSSLEALNISKQSRVGALGLLVYDYLITFGLEVDVVWRQSKRSWLCWIYLSNRFFPLVWLFLGLIPFSYIGIVSNKICIIFIAIDEFVVVISTLVVQVILQLRVYALYQKSRRVRIFLTCSWLAEVAVMTIFIGITLANLKTLPIISISTGCSYTGMFSIPAIFWLPALAYEPTLCLMVLWKAREEYWLELFWRRKRTPGLNEDLSSGKLVMVLARDSLIYFVGVFIELVINTVIWLHSTEHINAVVPWSGAIPSILGSRLFLSMREAIMFPERYDSKLYAGTSWIDAQGSIRFAARSQPATRGGSQEP